VPLINESEEPSTDCVSQGSSEEQDMLLAPGRHSETVAEAELASSGLAEEVTMEMYVTDTGTKQIGMAWAYPISVLLKKKRTVSEEAPHLVQHIRMS